MNWHEHYRIAGRRRRAAGGDLVRRFIRRRQLRRRTLMLTCGLCLATLMLAFFVISGP
jgi:hypothetical protein